MDMSLKTEPAADYLGVAKSTMEAWRVRGGGPRFVKLGKAVRYRKEDLDAFVNSRIFSSTSEASK